MPEIMKRRRTGKRTKSVRRQLRGWYARNRYRANMVIAAGIAAAIGLSLAFVMLDHGDRSPQNDTSSVAQ